MYYENSNSTRDTNISIINLKNLYYEYLQEGRRKDRLKMLGVNKENLI